LSKSALGKFELPLVFGQKLEHTSDMANVILISFAVNKDVIKEDQYKLLETWR
jgi:hypothetical protein